MTFHVITEGLDPAEIRNVHFAKENLTLNIGAKVMVTVNDLGGKM